MMKTRPTAVAVLLAVVSIAAAAGIVTDGPNPMPLPECPFAVAPWVCKVDNAAHAVGVVGGFNAVRIGQGGFGALTVGADSSLIVSSNPSTQSGNVVVGDNVGSAAHLSVINGGTVSINAVTTASSLGGLLVGPFAAAPNTLMPSTTMFIANGSKVEVFKQGGFGVGSAVGVGFAAGSFSSVVLDGGIGGFGNPALGATLNTTGNISIGREGKGSVGLARNATLNADLIFLSAISPLGSSQLNVGFNSTVNATAVYAGIALNLNTNQIDANLNSHGQAFVSIREFGSLDSTLTLGKGGTLLGTGHVANLINHGGFVRPGFSPGRLTIDHDFTDIGGKLVIEIGPHGSDFLDVLGALSLEDTSIEFSFTDGFAPQAGFEYDFMDASSIAGLVGVRYSFSGLQPGFAFDVKIGADGQFAFIARTDGVAIPEPSTLAMLGAALLAGCTTTRRRRRSAHLP